MKWDEWRGSLDGRPTMWIKRLLTVRAWKLDLHKFVAADDSGCYHTHPAFAVRLILWGGYVEDLQSQPARCWWPGRLGIVAPGLSHRIASLRNGRASYSLWLRGPKCAEVELRGDGWDAQRAAGVQACSALGSACPVPLLCERDGACPSGVPPCAAPSTAVAIGTAAFDRIADGFIKDVSVRHTMRDEFIEALEEEAEEHGRTAGVPEVPHG